jgi:hypothetical protein
MSRMCDAVRYRVPTVLYVFPGEVGIFRARLLFQAVYYSRRTGLQDIRGQDQGIFHADNVGDCSSVGLSYTANMNSIANLNAMFVLPPEHLCQASDERLRYEKFETWIDGVE